MYDDYNVTHTKQPELLVVARLKYCAFVFVAMPLRLCEYGSQKDQRTNTRPCPGFFFFPTVSPFSVIFHGAMLVFILASRILHSPIIGSTLYFSIRFSTFTSYSTGILSRLFWNAEAKSRLCVREGRRHPVSVGTLYRRCFRLGNNAAEILNILSTMLEPCS